MQFGLNAQECVIRQFVKRFALIGAVVLLPIGTLNANDALNDEIADPQQAAALVTRMAESAFAVSAATTQGTRPGKARDALRALLAQDFNIRYIAHYTLGSSGRSLDADAMAAYDAAFADYLIGRYAAGISTKGGVRFTVVGAEHAGVRDAVVTLKVSSEPARETVTQWRVRVFSGRAQIIDAAIDGEWLSVHERADCDALVKRIGVQGLLARVLSVADNY